MTEQAPQDNGFTPDIDALLQANQQAQTELRQKQAAELAAQEAAKRAAHQAQLQEAWVGKLTAGSPQSENQLQLEKASLRSLKSYMNQHSRGVESQEDYDALHEAKAEFDYDSSQSQKIEDKHPVELAHALKDAINNDDKTLEQDVMDEVKRRAESREADGEEFVKYFEDRSKAFRSAKAETVASVEPSEPVSQEARADEARQAVEAARTEVEPEHVEEVQEEAPAPEEAPVPEDEPQAEAPAAEASPEAEDEAVAEESVPEPQSPVKVLPPMPVEDQKPVSKRPAVAAAKAGASKLMRSLRGKASSEQQEAVAAPIAAEAAPQTDANAVEEAKKSLRGFTVGEMFGELPDELTRKSHSVFDLLIERQPAEGEAFDLHETYEYLRENDNLDMSFDDYTKLIDGFARLKFFDKHEANEEGGAVTYTVSEPGADFGQYYATVRDSNTAQEQNGGSRIADRSKKLASAAQRYAAQGAKKLAAARRR